MTLLTRKYRRIYTRPRPRTLWTIAGLSLAFLGLVFLAMTPGQALAQSLTLDMGGSSGSTSSRVIQLIALTTVLSLAPGILMMVTSFTRIIVVLHFVRQALGTQTSPPNMVLVSLALFLTAYIMAPTFQASYNSGISPYMNGTVDEMTAFDNTVAPFHAFMMTHVRQSDLVLFMDLSKSAKPATPELTPLKALIPAFVISELKRAFEIGFLLYIPFIVIDMVIASVLMSMGMMMLPPVMMAMPFKLIFFVLVDGWYLIAGSLVQSFGP